jgi:hypothetical protein
MLVSFFLFSFFKGSDVDRSYKAAATPEVTGANNLESGGGSRGQPSSGSGKGGHDPKTLGEKKGLGAHKDVQI